MSLSNMEKGEETIELTHGSAGDQPESGPTLEYHRKLALLSIIFGCSCVGCKALESSFKAQYDKRPGKAEKHSKRARKYSIISIVTLVGIIISIPVLIVLISYLLTLMD